MTDSEKKSQKEIAQVKGPKGRHTSGWVKLPAKTEDKLCLDDSITKLKNVVLQWHANCMN